MNAMEEACPHEAETRAARCESCCHENGSLTPCVVAWLEQRTGTVGLPMRTVPQSPPPMQRAA